jgi:Rps23 Pro-64 3,4-dihydroxylase Tpa1-like proline 4-hydroxylase
MVDIDRTALGSWINPQHLEEDALRSYRESFQAHPGRLVLLRDFLVDKVAEKLARFLRDEVEFKREHGLYSVEGAVSEEEWQRANEEDRFFRLSRLASTPPQFQMSPNTLTYLRFRQTFQRPQFVRFFETLTALELGSSDDFGVHSMTVGDYLRPHSDDNRNRRVALVIYLSPGWKPEYGGALDMIDRDGNVTSMVPEYNSMVVFDVLAGTTHLVAPVEPAAGDMARLTIGGWYPRPD